MPKELDLRPSQIIELFWKENLVIEEDSEFLEPLYLETL
jgi:hypothetical protein